MDFSDVEKHDDRLKNAIHEQIYRLHPYLCNAVRNFVKDNHANLNMSSAPEGSMEKSQQQQIPANKEFYVDQKWIDCMCVGFIKWGMRGSAK